MLHRLRGMGFTARVLEAGSGVGGTWYWNRYPGARCDVESVQYSYQFDDELQQEWEWTERYATQPEMLRYANHVADRFDLRRDIQFDTRVKSAAFDEAPGSLGHRDQRRRPRHGDLLHHGHGLPVLAQPAASSRAWTFKGERYHTGYWPHEGVDFTGKRVAIIGTGSSAVQSIPIIAAQAKHLSVFQRTPNYAVPAHNAPLDPEYVRADQGGLPGAAGARQADHDRHRLRLQRPGGAGDAARGAHARVRAALAAWRAVVPRRLQGPDGRPGGQRHGGRVRARQDPRARARPRDRRAAGAQEHHRLQAAVRRHRLLRDLQPAQRRR